MIPRGVDTDYYKPAPENDDLFRVVFVGMLCIRKGVHCLLEAWKKLNLKNAELVLVGAIHGEIKPVLEKYYSIKNIKITGFVENPAKLYNSASLFVFPSLDEGSAKVNYEAMACGLPVITTPNAGSLVIDGVDGFVIPIRDVEAIIEKTRLLYENREMLKQMGESARKNIESYTWQRYEESLVNFYDSLIRN